MIIESNLFGFFSILYAEEAIENDSDNNNGKDFIYRSISLLNSDYKLLSRILKNRLERVMRVNRILSDGQKCSNSEHNIFQATLALKDWIASLRHH